MTKIWLIANVASIIFAIGAVLCIALGRTEGWGWLILAAVITHSAGANQQ